MLPQLALIAALLSPNNVGITHRDNQTQHIAGWTLKVRVDNFSGGRICSLKNGKITYQRQAIVLHLPDTIDTTQAIYRVDNGPVQLSRDDDVSIAHLGFAIDQPVLDNPSGGLVRIPASKVLGAALLQIELSAFGHPRRYNISGLGAALTAAATNGCGNDNFQ